MLTPIDAHWNVVESPNFWEVLCNHCPVTSVTLRRTGEYRATRPLHEVPEHVLEELPEPVAAAISARRVRFA